MVCRRLSPSTCASEAQRLEYPCKCRVADVQAAGIGAKCRHHRALAVTGETAPFHRATARRHPRFRMQMAGDFARCAGRLMAKRDRSDRNFTGDNAAEIARAARDRDCPKSRSSRAAPATLRWPRGPALTAGRGRRDRENCRRAQSPCGDRAAQSRRRADPASPPYRKAAAARRGRQNWSLFPDAGRRRRAGSVLPRTTHRRDRL